MGLMSILTDHLVEALAFALLGWIGTKMRRKLRRWDRLEAPRTVDTAAPADPLPEATVPAELPIPERIRELEDRRERAREAVRLARSREEDSTEHQRTLVDIGVCLSRMSFLCNGDVLEDRYRLLHRIGEGRFGVVWKAYDTERDDYVAVKLLKHSYVRDESVVQRFKYTARVMAGIGASNVASVYQTAREVHHAGTRCLCYYVMEYIDGRPLDEVAARSHDERDEIVAGLLEVTRGIASTHSDGIVHRDIKPGNILMTEDGTLKLVDFDAVLRLEDRRVVHREVGTFGYSAPEVLNGAGDPEVRADIFALGRVFSHVYYGKNFPHAYAMSVDETIDLLNCAPDVKEVLERASKVDPSDRYPTLRRFLNAMREAVGIDRRKGLPLLRTLERDKEKIYTILRHTALLTVIAIVPTRAVGSTLQAVQLSDTLPVAMFHGVLGALVWGTLIPAAFIVQLTVFGRRPWLRDLRGYLAAMLLCGLGGFLGGALLALPAVFVTNPDTLTCLGWLTGQAGGGPVDRLAVALEETRMMAAFPLTGFLTGCGVGLCLQLGVDRALERNPLGNGIIPVPARKPEEDLSLLASVLRSPKAHFFLLLPVLLSPVVGWILDPATVDAAACSVAPREFLRSFGEGWVHYFGAIGVTWAFLQHVHARPTDAVR